MGKATASAAVESAATSAQERPASNLSTVDEHEARTFPKGPKGQLHVDRWKHAAAAALHGWRAHAHHAGAPMRLTDADYSAALEAASKDPLTPHPAALSEHSPRASKRST